MNIKDYLSNNKNRPIAFLPMCLDPLHHGHINIIKEAKNIIKSGYQEITLLGQNVNSYKTSEGNFPVLLDKLGKIKAIKRIRYIV